MVLEYLAVDGPGLRVTVAWSKRGVAVVLVAKKGFVSQTSWGAHLRREAVPATEDPFGAEGQIRAYLTGRIRSFSLPLDITWGTPFQRQAWRAAQRIPYGQTVSYGQLARAAGRPRSARAMGQAMKVNPVPLLVPCHRVIAGDGGLGGFLGNQTALKETLLRLESAHR